MIGDEDLSSFHVEAVFNPFNREGQKFSSIMSVRILFEFMCVRLFLILYHILVSGYFG